MPTKPLAGKDLVLAEILDAFLHAECPECFGKGKRNLSDGSWMRCDYCNGRGAVTVKPDSADVALTPQERQNLDDAMASMEREPWSVGSAPAPENPR